MNSFVCATLSPLYVAGRKGAERIAVATVRAGGIGLLDAEFAPADALTDLVATVDRLLTSVSGPPSSSEGRASVGLRVAVGQIEMYGRLLQAFTRRPHCVVLCGWDADSLAAVLADLSTPGRQIWLEVGAVAETKLPLEVQGAAFTGWVARGSECGGRCGRESAFILCQHLAHQRRPFWVGGGIGEHTAAACRVAGAAGVVLDDALLLMPESSLSLRQREMLAQVDAQDTSVVSAAALAAPSAPEGSAPARLAGAEQEEAVVQPGYRILVRPGFDAARRLAASDGATTAVTVGWGDPKQAAWPLGQSGAWAAAWAQRYGTVGKAVQAILAASTELVQAAAEAAPLAPDAPLARRHGTLYPIVQGPMTRVSDRAEFAAAVAESGGLPLLALAQLREAEVAALLNQTRQQVGERAWGVGLLGFVAPDLRAEQMAVLEAVRPPFALIAGGRPDQAAPLEAMGIATYLHVPTPELLRIFLGQGARRFVFEGAECGGHVGPLTGFVLWQSVVDLMLSEVPAADLAQVQFLLAGGIHDACSAAMIATLVAPLAQRGAAAGVLMGSAYLFTEEAVTQGAIVAGMQAQALACRTTVTLETGPGHVIRCAQTPFAITFAKTRRRMRAAGQREADITKALEELVLGRLRVATKGLMRSPAGLHVVDDPVQVAEGLYMMGEVAALRGADGTDDAKGAGLTTCAALHEAVSVQGSRWVAQRADELAVCVAPDPATPANVAIIGAACLLPGAQDLETFWRNLLDKVETTREIPMERWDWRLLYDPDKSAPDKIYARWGGFIEPVPFDPLHYGIPPKALASISVAQLLALEVTRRALQDAGYGDAILDAETRRRTAVYFGAGNTADIEQLYMVRSALPFVIPLDPNETMGAEVLKRLPAWTEESYPGILANVIAGRVANRFDLGGPNLTVDAACASSLAALDLAVRELAAGRSDLVITGGIEFEQTPQAYLAFSKTQALSATGKARVFDQAGDGIVISEGAVVLVLKRLADAQRDGDRVYAVIQAVAGSSDGKGFGLTAPKPAGQRAALDRAHRLAGSDPATLQLYEAHATGTAVGDRSELEMIAGALKAAGAQPGACAIGSVKSLLGHTRAAAGVLGVLKAALALHHRVLPPHAGVEQPLAALADDNSCVYLLEQARPWLLAPGQVGAERRGEGPQRAGVSAFGFGGTNFHAVLEGYHGNVVGSEDWGAAQWPCELIVLTGASTAGLHEQITRLVRRLSPVSTEPSHAATLRLRDVAYTCARLADPTHAARLTMVVRSIEDLREKLNGCQAHFEQGGALPGGVFTTPGDMETGQGEVAFLFPGQGSQYPGMGCELGLYVPEVRKALTQARAACCDEYPGLDRLVWPDAAYNDAERHAQVRRLAATEVAQPAIAAISLGMLDFAARIGLAADRVAGHSFGEFLALHAAGVIDREALLRLAVRRGRIMADLTKVADGQREKEAGAMAVALLSRDALRPYLAAFPDVTIANINAPAQCALSGPVEAVNHITHVLQADGHTVHALPVAAAFHSPFMERARVPFAEFLEREIVPGVPLLPVHANLDGAPYPQTADKIRERWVGHLEQCVDFVAQIEQMYAAGVRTFVELGPGQVLTGLVRRILQDRPHRALAADGAGRASHTGLANWLRMLAELVAIGLPLQVEALFEGRAVQRIEVAEWTAEPAAAPRWLMDGGRIWQAGGASHLVGELPLLTQESRQVAPFQHTGWGMTLAPSGRDAAVAPEATIGVAYREYQETMRQFLAQQERMITQLMASELQRSMSGGADMVDSSSPAPTSPSANSQLRAKRLELPSQGGQRAGASQTPEPEARPMSDVLRADPQWPDRAELMRRLVTMVSERTGYPADMLDPGKDLEAELGVDSIKRIEILGRLPSLLPAAAVPRLQAQQDRLARLRSLNSLVDALMVEIDALPRGRPAGGMAPTGALDCAPVYVSERKGAELARPRPGEGAPGERDGAASSTSPRYVMRGIAHALPDSERGDSSEGWQGGLVLVTDDNLGVGRSVCDLLARRGVRAFLIERADLRDSERLEKRVMSLIYVYGWLRGVVHLAALGIPAECDGLAAWRETTMLTTKSFFHLLQLCALGFERALEPVQIVAAMQLGGAWGRSTPGTGTPAAGSAHGMLRTLEREYPKVLSKVVDFDATATADNMARQIVGELSTDDGSYEIGYVGNTRMQYSAIWAPLNRAQASFAWRPQAGWVVLVTGGARGITAEICRELAGPGVRLIVVGRSPVAPVRQDAGAAEEDLAALRRRLIAEMRRQGVERTPAEIESEVRAMQRANERHKNLDALTATGADVEYHALDVRSEAALGDLIDSLYARYGRIDAVVHGAGIIEDRQVEEKEAASFERVFDTKVDSTYILGRHLRPEGLRWVVFFSSVAGRFGNQGQVDYAAANEVVNRLACQFDAWWPATRVVSINWGPWRGAGMATQGIQRQFAGKGISPIEREDGLRFFADELTYGQKGEVEVIAGEGPWKVDSRDHASIRLELGALLLGIRTLAADNGQD